MDTIVNKLTLILQAAFEKAEFSHEYGTVVVSKTEFCQYQCNGALAAAKRYGQSPIAIAEKVVSVVDKNEVIKDVEVVKPGFININLTDEFLVSYCNQMLESTDSGIEKSARPKNLIIDFGGPNVAKPLHVGHLRSAIIGESLKRITRLLGHEIIGDIHLGDWGLQMGMIIAHFEETQPDLAFFKPDFSPEKDPGSPVTIEELEYIYPQASTKAKADEVFMAKAKKATFELQNGNEGYLALWRHIVSVSVNDLKQNYDNLNVSFDLWEGESDSQEHILPMIETLKNQNFAAESQGALVVDVSEPTDKTDVPPLILTKSDGAVLYSTTDLATIKHRVEAYNPDNILYVVDKRQAVHFDQVFRAANKTGIAPSSLKLEHIAFGTMNGKDGKPFKTREGGVMKLSALIETLINEALQRMSTVAATSIETDDERQKVARLVGIAALKFGDLINLRTSDYIFDLEKFSAFEGKTGPYLLYSVVRIKSILRKANDLNYIWSKINGIESDIERSLLLKLTEIQDTVNTAFDLRYPSILAEYLYALSNLYNSYYHAHHILKEEDNNKKNSRLAVISLTRNVMELCLELLGIEVPERM